VNFEGDPRHGPRTEARGFALSISNSSIHPSPMAALRRTPAHLVASSQSKHGAGQGRRPAVLTNSINEANDAGLAPTAADAERRGYSLFPLPARRGLGLAGSIAPVPGQSTP
jgi:hypothetical protein